VTHISPLSDLSLLEHILNSWTGARLLSAWRESMNRRQPQNLSRLILSLLVWCQLRSDGNEPSRFGLTWVGFAFGRGADLGVGPIRLSFRPRQIPSLAERDRARLPDNRLYRCNLAYVCPIAPLAFRLSLLAQSKLRTAAKRSKESLRLVTKVERTLRNSERYILPNSVYAAASSKNFFSVEVGKTVYIAE
jgi:hypothetical protein